MAVFPSHVCMATSDSLGCAWKHDPASKFKESGRGRRVAGRREHHSRHRRPADSPNRAAPRARADGSAERTERHRTHQGPCRGACAARGRARTRRGTGGVRMARTLATSDSLGCAWKHDPSSKFKEIGILRSPGHKISPAAPCNGCNGRVTAENRTDFIFLAGGPGPQIGRGGAH